MGCTCVHASCKYVHVYLVYCDQGDQVENHLALVITALFDFSHPRYIFWIRYGDINFHFILLSAPCYLPRHWSKFIDIRPRLVARSGFACSSEGNTIGGCGWWRREWRRRRGQGSALTVSVRSAFINMQNQLRPGPIVPVLAVATTKRVGLRRGGPPEANGALIRSHFFTRSEITAFPARPGRPGRFSVGSKGGPRLYVRAHEDRIAATGPPPGQNTARGRTWIISR